MDFLARTMPSRRAARTLPLAALLVLGATLPAPVRPGSGRPGDDEAVEIARRMLDAMDAGWNLAAYDRADRVRASINLRGAGSGGASLALTANLALDRGGRRWRLDTAGDVGPLTLAVTPQRAVLYVPALAQYATRPPGELALDPRTTRGLASQTGEMRRRLDEGYDALQYLGQETVDGAATDRIRDTPEPGLTATYWIDRRTSLPRRVVLSRGAGRETRIELRYGSGPRPTRVEATLPGSAPTRVTLLPTYDSEGRVAHVAVDVRPPGGNALQADVNLRWSPRLTAEFFRFTPPDGTDEVPFGQLLQGVVFSAAGKLGGLVQLFAGAG